MPQLSVLILIVAILAYGYLSPRFLKGHRYTLLNIVFAVSTLLYVKISGSTATEMGLTSNFVAICLAVMIILVALLIVTLVFKMRKVKFNSNSRKELLIRVPFGTALSEELIFRGSLMGVLLQNYSKLASLIVSSAVFGFWHILPRTNEIWARNINVLKGLTGIWAKVPTFGITLIATFLGGLFFGLLRLSSASVMLPWAVHTAVNTIGWTISRIGNMERQGAAPK